MGEELGSVYDALWQHIGLLHVRWQQYRELFGTKPERIDLLNDTAGLFFRVVQDVFWEATLLDLAKLTDPAISPGNKANLTVTRLPMLVDDAVRNDVAALAEKARRATEFARDWRNRHIAHNDLHLALAAGAKPLAEASRAHVEESLTAITAVLNAVSRHYLRSTTDFRTPPDPRGAVSLLYVLHDGLEADKKRRQRLTEGRYDPDDFGPSPDI